MYNVAVGACLLECQLLMRQDGVELSSAPSWPMVHRHLTFEETSTNCHIVHVAS
jgi:hypothetical protein